MAVVIDHRHLCISIRCCLHIGFISASSKNRIHAGVDLVDCRALDVDMDAGILADLRALALAAGFVGAPPAIRRRSAEYIEAYHRIVGPIVASTIGTDGPSVYTGDAMRESAVKVCFMLAAFARTAGVPFRVDDAILVGPISRVYDDLFDEYDDDEALQRITALFDGKQVSPVRPVEKLLFNLYLELDRRLNRTRDDAIYSALNAAHDAQLRSRQQRDSAIPTTTLMNLTLDKGAYASIVFFGVAKPLTQAELPLIGKLGAAIQLFDDYYDIAADRRIGITTSATRGDGTLASIGRLLRELRPAIRKQYGTDQPLFGVIYLYLWLGFFKRRLPARLTSTRRRGVVQSLARTSTIRA